ncbi:MAG: hypothetical protein OXC05_03755 [Halieaceae bacterium]|nr:hypothetical protein [Halieaceae bacterium]
MAETEIEKEKLYAVFAEAKGHQKPLIQVELTFPRLVDDIIVPYQTGESFFIDGAPLTSESINRIKVLKLTTSFSVAKHRFDRTLTRGRPQEMKILGDQYSTRLEHIMRQNAEDVTSQVLKAINQEIMPSIKEYLPKRDELISAATKIFIESIKALGS